MNFQLRLLCPLPKKGAELKSPWNEKPGCFTGSSQLVLRKLKCIDCVDCIDDVPLDYKCYTYRLLTGVEAMAMSGWCFSLWPKEDPYPSNELLLSLAGNAFSLFAFGPCWIAMLASLSVPLPSLPADVSSDNDLVVDSSASDPE